MTMRGLSALERACEGVAIFRDHLEATVHEAPRLNVLLSEVGLASRRTLVSKGRNIPRVHETRGRGGSPQHEPAEDHEVWILGGAGAYGDVARRMFAGDAISR